MILETRRRSWLQVQLSSTSAPFLAVSRRRRPLRRRHRRRALSLSYARFDSAPETAVPTRDNQEMDTALIKYRVAAVQTPNSAQLWNNIGMCFFGKGVRKVVTHVACVLAQPRESQEPTYFSYPPPTRLRVSFPHGGSLLFEARPLFGSFRVDHMLQPWASAPEHRPVCLRLSLL